ncbi:hypothetical protein [Streptosporangium carneum]|uniref:hypothetical protein n=1 Tax=Streptosporangium carneum TaxID=47481 RepID=UPI0022F2B480|nr:hypothetical protein [Streptosporangium carneum]
MTEARPTAAAEVFAEVTPTRGPDGFVAARAGETAPRGASGGASGEEAEEDGERVVEGAVTTRAAGAALG